MPLLPPVLIQKLLNLDVPQGPADPATTANKWFDAWWSYAQGMVFLVPGGGGQALVQGPFIGILLGACTPSPAPAPFFLALEGAMRASWAILGTPAGLLPPALAAIPAPAPLAPMLVSVVPTGIASPVPPPPRIQMAAMIDVWTRTHIVIGPLGPLGPFT